METQREWTSERPRKRMRTEADSEMKLMNGINGSRMVFTCAYVSHLMASGKNLEGCSQFIISFSIQSYNYLNEHHFWAPIKKNPLDLKISSALPNGPLHYSSSPSPSPIMVYIPWPYRIKYVVIISHRSTCRRKKVNFKCSSDPIPNRWKFEPLDFILMYYSSSFLFELFEMKWNEMETASTEKITEEERGDEEKKRRKGKAIIQWLPVRVGSVSVCEYFFVDVNFVEISKV